MAPGVASLFKRQNCYNSIYGYNCGNSSWYGWGRWVVFAVIVVAAFVLFFLFACLSARRRRRYGQQPYRGTGWARAPWGHGQAQYNPNYPQREQQQWQQTPPSYAPPQNGYYSGQNNQQPGYFGGGNQGAPEVELQQPGHTYRGGENVYSPPSGPPPGKKDDVIR